ILGTAGLLTIGDGRLDFQVFETELRQEIRESDGMYLQPTPRHAEPVELPDSQPDHTAVYRDLHAAILTGYPLPLDGGAARMSVELANAITYSSRRNVAVELPLDRAAYVALLNELRDGG